MAYVASVRQLDVPGRYDDPVDGKEQKIDVSQVDVSTNRIELQYREFFAAITEGCEPNASVHQVRP